MGVFDIFNSNKRKWMIVLSSKEVPDNMKYIVKEFFIKDNISIEKYQENSRVNKIVLSLGLETWNMMNEVAMEPEPELRCTPSFKKHFTGSVIERALGIPDWFYLGYPDVLYWFQTNLSEISKEFAHREEEFSTHTGLLHFYRMMIQRYKINIGRLECST